MRNQMILAGIVLVAGTLTASAASIEKEITVKAPADKVWAMIGPFCSIDKWHPAIGTCTEDNGVRTLTTKDGKGTAPPTLPPPLPGASLAACPAPAAAAPSCRPPLAPAVRTELLFGAAEVDTPSWARFVAGAVTPRFPDGLTILDARGQWRGPGGILRESAECW